uniref:Beta-lactamase domain-containing protein n=2 Tax=Mesocestoides corti TaxID=53468 RepID=A0A5K3FZ12_MESCO
MKSRVLIAFAWGMVTRRPGSSTTSELDGITGSSLHQTIKSVDQLIETFKATTGAPGVSACISIGGAIIYSKGFGLADVEQGVSVSPQTKFRIASISKSFTSLLTGRLIDQARLDLNADIRTYLPDFSPKTLEGKSSPISMKHLLSHTSGVRDYYKAGEEKKTDMCPEEMLITKAYDSAHDSLAIFRDDALIHLPGEDYLYSSHGYVVAAAVIEAIVANTHPPKPLFERPARLKEVLDINEKKDTGTKLSNDSKSGSLFKQLFAFLGLHNTCLDEPNAVIPFRARPYRREKSNGCLANTPWVDNSYKWSGGGILSTAPDLIQMANHVAGIYLGQYEGMENLAVVSRKTLVNFLWSPVCGTVQGSWLPGGLYGLGWFVARRSTAPSDKARSLNQPDRLYVGHTGGAVGFTSILLLSLPICMEQMCQSAPSLVQISQLPPICVAILVNQEGAHGIGSLAIQIVETLTGALLASNISNNWTSLSSITAKAAH